MPSGWTLRSSANAAMDLSIMTRVAGASEPASYEFTATANHIAAAVLRYSGADGSAFSTTSIIFGLDANFLLNMPANSASLVIVCNDTTPDDLSPTSTPPTGYTLVVQELTNELSLFIWSKLGVEGVENPDAADPGTNFVFPRFVTCVGIHSQPQDRGRARVVTSLAASATMGARHG